MSGLRARMNRLRGTGETAEEAIRDEAVKEEEPTVLQDEASGQDEAEWLDPAWSAFGVKLHTNERGSFLLRKTSYPAAHRHGLHALSEMNAAAAGLAAFYQSHSVPTPDQIIFLDLETTGLGVGAGNVPFMIGIGYMREGGFVIEQMMIRHPVEEYAMLNYLVKKLSHYTFLATYNGKTFDWPLVQNRLIMNGLRRHAWEPRHLDFLHPSRAIWRNTLTSCRLSHVEEERLGIERGEDVPGSLAPQLYFQYLADGNVAPLEGVFRHNESDLLSLACLTVRFGYLLNENLSEYIPLPTEPEEMIRTGLWLEKMGKTELPEHLFNMAMKAEHASPSSLLMLAVRDKKAGNWERAVVLWQKAILHSERQHGQVFREACIELAMYYEHKTKDYHSALIYANRAYEDAADYPQLHRDRKLRAELEAVRNRIARLQRKLGPS